MVSTTLRWMVVALVFASVGVAKAQCPTGECLPIGTDPAFSDNQTVLSPPIVGSPLYACTNLVVVSGFVPGATLRVFVNGTQVGSAVVANLPDRHVFTLPFSLTISPTQVVTATQQFGSTQSMPSAGVQVRSHTLDHPAGVPQMTLNPLPLYACGRVVSAGGWIGGSTITATRSVTAPTSVSFSNASWTSYASGHNLGETVTVSQQICGVASPPRSTTVVARLGTLEAPSIAQAFVGQRYLEVNNAVFGASFNITRSGTNLAPGAVASWDRTAPAFVELASPLAAGSATIAITQSLCASTSPAGPATTVAACTSFPPALIDYPEIGDTTVRVIQRVPGSRIQVFTRPIGASSPVTEIGDGGGSEIRLTQALAAGQQLIVVQSLGSCRSSQAHVLDVTCSRPNREYVRTDGPFNVRTEDYDLGTVTIAGITHDGMPYPARRIATVYYPIDPLGSSTQIPAWAGPRPIVFLVHGNSAALQVPTSWDTMLPPCATSVPGIDPLMNLSINGLMAVHADQIPGLLACSGTSERVHRTGYAYLAQSLAQSGVIVVSIHANDVTNANVYEAAGAALVQSHVDAWAIFQTGALASPLSTLLAGRVALDRAGLIGHSRGGAIVSAARNTNTNPAVTYRAIYLLAPTSPSSVATGVPVAVVFGARDGDLRSGDPLRAYDLSTVPLRSLQYIYGANHNRFNAVWPDDGTYVTSTSGSGIPDLTAAQQRYIARAYVRSWFDWHLFDASVTRNRALASGDADVDLTRDAILTSRPIILPSFSTTDDIMLDDLENMVVGTTSPLGAPVSVTGTWTLRQELPFSGGARFNTTFWHATSGLVAGWPATGPTMTFSTPGSGVAPGDRGFLQMRLAVIQEQNTDITNDLAGTIRVVGAGGGVSSAVPLASLPRVPRPYPATPMTVGFRRTVLRTLRIPLRCFSGISTQTIQGVVVAPEGNSQRMALDDIQLSR
jgi:hypothetical protein